MSPRRQWLLEAPLTSSLSRQPFVLFPFLWDGEAPGKVFTLNLRPHGITSSRGMAGHLFGLGAAGLIEFKKPVSSREELRRQLEVPYRWRRSPAERHNAYTLTRAGFEWWESVAEPDWERFSVAECTGRSDRPNERRLEVTAPSEATTRRVWEAVCRRQEIDPHDTAPVSETMRDWRPNPWVVFPEAVTWRVRLHLPDRQSRRTLAEALEGDRLSRELRAADAWIRHPVTTHPHSSGDR